MTTQRKRLFSLLIAGVLFSTAGRTAMVLDSIRIENQEAAALDPSFVRAYVSLRAGQELADERQLNAAVAQDVDSLRRSGRFSYVRAVLEERGGELTLVYRVEPRLRLRSIKISGAEQIGNKKIKNKLELELGDYIDDAIVGEKVRQVEAYCREQKYPDASVAWELSPNRETSAADLLITVVEGDKLRVKEIHLKGDRFLSDRFTAQTGRFLKKLIPGNVGSKRDGWYETDEVRDLLNQKTTFWITPWGGAYRPELVDVDVAAIKRFYRDHGFLDVRVEPPELENKGDGCLELTYRITEGPRYRVGSMRVEGVELFEKDAVKKQVRLMSGDLASAADMNAAAETITRYYGNRGYIHTRVEQVPRTDPDSQTVDVTLRVVEGTKAYINQVYIRGNETTRDEVIRRELAVAPRETFNQRNVETSKNRLRNLDYFSMVDSTYRPLEGTNTYDLTFDVTEKAMGSFMIGAGFSSIDSLVGYTEVSHGNFDIRRWPPVGDGQKVKLRLQVGSERNDVEVSFSEPWFLDRKLALGVDAYHRTASFHSDFYDLSTTGGRLSLTKPITPFTRGTLSYSLESFDVFDVTAPTNSFIAQEEGVRTKSALGLTLSRDTRDQFFIPTRGNRSLAGVAFSGGPLGGDTDIVSFEAKSSQYWPLWKDHVLNVKGELRTVDSRGSGDVPIFDRLFLGGPRSLRGFEYRDVSPRDPNNNNEPYGGKSSWFATVEYIIPLWSKIRGAVFYDVGAVSLDTLEFVDPEINSSYGIGARFDLPMFPLRLDYAFPHVTDDYNERASPRFNFSLGRSF